MVYGLLSLFAVKTLNRNAEWKDTEGIAASGLKMNPGNAKIYLTMGNMLAQKVRNTNDEREKERKREREREREREEGREGGREREREGGGRGGRRRGTVDKICPALFSQNLSVLSLTGSTLQ